MIISLDEKQPLETQAEVGEGRKTLVTLRKSTSSQRPNTGASRISQGPNTGIFMIPKPSNFTLCELQEIQFLE
ncbi:hypothetical protein HAX54_030193, partial [Datura stramonium]|nr:hypothetical protein [Datura stramonium]